MGFIKKLQDKIKEKRAKMEQKKPTEIVAYSEDKKLGRYLEQINKLRKNGENRIIFLKNENKDIQLNKQISKEEKAKRIAANKKLIEKAKVVQAKNKEEIKALIKEGKAAANVRYKQEYNAVIENNVVEMKKIKEQFKVDYQKAKEEHAAKVAKINLSSFKNKDGKKIDLRAESATYDSIKHGLINSRDEKIDALKQECYSAYKARYYYVGELKNERYSVGEKIANKWHYFITNFNFGRWLLKYALYIVIITIFIILAIISKTKGSTLLSGDAITKALTQISPKIFFSLGVACLILLGGTDLSIGRLTGIGVSFSLMAMSTSTYADNYGHVWLHINNAPAGGRVIVGLLLSIIFCTAFSTFSGFFTAKFKIHPFITTLATQLISYGLFQLFWSATSSFSMPEGSLGPSLRGNNGWQLILYAVIAILIVWFIWNKTRFGKNLYAVGGNEEAARVSGINPFVVTLLAFVMAGILYGCGGFVQAVQVGTGNFSTGYGTETDAIAACVIGGISFTGGVGKVSGAVIGTVVLGFLTFAFSNIGLDANLQLVIKGAIILFAVALDCVKYLRKR